MEKEPRHHLAIFNPPFLDLILEGKKTVEGRFSKVRCAPFGKVSEGDVIFMKESGGLIKGLFVVSAVESVGDLTPEKLTDLKARYDTPLRANADPEYWQRRKTSKYATLLQISHPVAFKHPFSFPKRDRRGWVVLDTPIVIPK